MTSEEAMYYSRNRNISGVSSANKNHVEVTQSVNKVPAQ